MLTEPSEISSAEECYRCGYDLRGIADAQPCPECGLLAERSRRVTDELHNTRPAWLRRLSLGVWVIVLAVLMPFLWGISLNRFARQAQIYLYGGSTVTWGWWIVLAMWLPGMGIVIGAILLLVGAILLTTPEGYEPADRADRRWRKLLRISAAVPPLAIVVETGWSIFQQWQAFTRKTISDPDWLGVVLVVIFAIGAAPVPMLVFFQLRRLAKRAKSAHLAEHCAIVGIGASGAVLFIIGMVLLYAVMNHSSDATYWTTRSPISAVLSLTAGVAASLFAMWSLYLLIRFGIAFGLASRQLRKTWRRDDRTVSADVEGLS